MNLGNILDLLNRISPFNLQESWDNSGLQIGSRDFKLTNIYTTLELSSKVIENVAPNSLIISHHPLFFKAIKCLDFSNYPANLARQLMEKNCAQIATHTNFDKTHLNAKVAQILGLEITFQEDFIIFASIQKTPILDIAKSIAKKLELDLIKLTKANDFVENIALVCGSGCSLMPQIHEIIKSQNLQNTLFLTGDVKYHDAMNALSLNISIMDILHFQSERIFAQLMSDILSNHGYKAIICNSQNPFAHIGI
ncbi:MAG: Nif3-like dinuclear metal center hexameric protein [Helicobacter sp.]|nr:Nif3-like dinuclear metal center hexameric protein [Helicobacter sp.]